MRTEQTSHMQTATNPLTKLAAQIDALVGRIGRTIAWVGLGIVLVQFFVVVLRYVYGVNALWAQELVVYGHGFVIMLGAAYTLQVDGHVRVDIYYREMPQRSKRTVNFWGALMLLLPMALIVIYQSFGYVISSWEVFEGSPEAAGLRGVYILKTTLLVFGVLMTLGAIALAIRSRANQPARAPVPKPESQPE